MIQALVKELQLRKEVLRNRTIETIYFGGGTPSLLAVDELLLLVHTIRQNYRVVKNPEITLEANPDDLTNIKIEELAKSPINRLSIGIQSFFDEDLVAMNRAHNSKEAKNCLSVATRHFDNITIDLIYGIPGMSIERWKENLQIAFNFGVNHISSYALTVEPKTALDIFIKQGNYPKLSDELAEQHFNILVEETKKNDFVQYEISNFGKKDYFSKHNTGYWLGKSYLGIGPSAHSFHDNQRSWNVSNNIKYVKAIQENSIPNEVEELSEKDRFNEYVMTGLRTIWGVSLHKITEEFGLSVKQELLTSAQKFIDEGLLTISNDFDSDQKTIEKLKTTMKGKFLADGLSSELFILN